MNDVNDSVVNVAPVAQKRRGRPVDPNSGLARARALAATLPEGLTRQETIAKFQTIEVNGVALSKDTAAAYYSVINRKSK